MSEHSPQYYRDKADYLEEKASRVDPVEALISGSPQFGPDCILVSKIDVGDETYVTLRDRWGGIFDHSTIQRLLDVIAPFLDTFDDEEIEEMNVQLYHQRREEDRGAQRSREERQRAQPKPKRRPKAGYVYLIKGGHTGTYKIGLSVKPQSRLWQLQGQTDQPLQIHHLIETYDMTRTEKGLHTLFVDKRIGGEWFELSDSDIDRIKNLTPDQLIEVAE